MAVQARLDIHNEAFVLSGDTYMREAETISQIIGRAVPLAPKTVMARNGAQWLPLSVVDPEGTPANMLTGAFGTDMVGFQAVNNASFRATVDGSIVDITALDLSDLSTPLDTPASLTCDTNGSILAAWQAVTAAVKGDFTITINGVLHTFTGLDFAGIAALTDIPGIINAATVPHGLRCVGNAGGTVFTFYSTLTGQTATLSFLGLRVGGTLGTDISGVTGNLFLNGDAAPATIVNGSGGIYGTSLADLINAAAAGAFHAELGPTGTTMRFISPTTGEESTVAALLPVAPGVGTDISGAGFLNGLAAAPAVITASAGMDDINLPAGIYIGDAITAAALVAGNVVNCPIMVGGTATIDSTQIVLEGGLTLATEIPSLHKPIEDVLLGLGLTPEDTTLIAGYEN